MGMNLLKHYRTAGEFIRERSVSCFGGCRQGNYNFLGWWRHNSPEPGWKRRLNLADPADYAWLIRRGRTLYWTTAFFSPGTFQRSVEDQKEKTELGGPSDIHGVTPFVDIDLYGPFKPRITEKAIRGGLEYAIRFVADRWREVVPSGTFAYFSGGGGYVNMAPAVLAGPAHPRLHSKIAPAKLRLFLDLFQAWLFDMEKELFAEKPSLEKILKFDRLNHPVRLQKTVWSVHKSLPLCCTPLETENPVIDLAEAKVPVPQATLNKYDGWGALDGHIPEQEVRALGKVLEKYVETARENRSRRIAEGEECPDYRGGVKILGSAASAQFWPPCIKWIVYEADLKFRGGATRALAFLAAFLGQAGHGEEEAYALWETVAGRFGVDTPIQGRSHYFTDWFRSMSCPSCRTINTTKSGYPELTMGELPICKPDRICRGMQLPLPLSYVRAAMAEKGQFTMLRPDPTRVSYLQYRPRKRKRKRRRRW